MSRYRVVAAEIRGTDKKMNGDIKKDVEVVKKDQEKKMKAKIVK
jgi:hypothetical protein